jgi:hypothetical protein
MNPPTSTIRRVSAALAIFNKVIGGPVQPTWCLGNQLLDSYEKASTSLWRAHIARVMGETREWMLLKQHARPSSRSPPGKPYARYISLSSRKVCCRSL